MVCSKKALERHGKDDSEFKILIKLFHKCLLTNFHITSEPNETRKKFGEDNEYVMTLLRAVSPMHCPTEAGAPCCLELLLPSLKILEKVSFLEVCSNFLKNFISPLQICKIDTMVQLSYQIACHLVKEVIHLKASLEPFIDFLLSLPDKIDGPSQEIIEAKFEFLVVSYKLLPNLTRREHLQSFADKNGYSQALKEINLDRSFLDLLKAQLPGS